MVWPWVFALVQCLILSVDSLDGPAARDALPEELSRLSGNGKDGIARGKRESQVIERMRN